VEYALLLALVALVALASWRTLGTNVGTAAATAGNAVGPTGNFPGT
jgi:Flp pilus assembly pilin Flp